MLSFARSFYSFALLCVANLRFTFILHFTTTNNSISEPSDNATVPSTEDPTLDLSSSNVESSTSFGEKEGWIMLMVLTVMIAVACIVAVFLFMRRKMNKLEQKHAAEFPKGERDDISEIDTKVAVQETSISVVNEDERAEGVSVQHEHATETVETSQGAGDV